MDDDCDARVQRLATPKECAIFERNARDRGREDLAVQARQRWIELTAGATASDADEPLQRELRRTLAAFEYLLGRSATGARQTIRRRGLVKAADQFACKGGVPLELAALADAGLLEYAWEQVVLRHPEAFSEAAASHARERLDEHGRLAEQAALESAAG